jgi:FKBP-type peptidyl-prolyl cis-trans isomerase (trigger factor)
MNIKNLITKNNTAQVLLTVTAKEVASAQKQALDKLSKNISVKGFRKGNVPSAIAKKEIGEEKLKKEAVNICLESGILQIIKEKHYELIGLPQLDKTDFAKKTAWEFTLSLPLNPKIDLGEYKKPVQTILQKTKDKTKEQKLSAIVDTLIKKTSFTVPTVLIEREVDSSLSRLVQQTESLNLDINTYLKSVNKTAEQIKKEYFKKAEENIKVDLILSKIAQDFKVNVSPEEIKDFAKASSVPPERHQSLVPIITRRKTLDQLLNL